jgi:hypothetical protein
MPMMSAVDTYRSKKMKRVISIVSIVVTAIMVCLCLLMIMVITSTFARGSPPGKFFPGYHSVENTESLRAASCCTQ